MTTTSLIKQLLEAGVHFGHQTSKWNPKMKKYIFGQRSGIYIVDLEQTAARLVAACEFLRKTALAGGEILFVGTKKQAQEVIKQEAQRCGMFHVNQRWLGGTLTNFSTIQKSIKRLKAFQDMQESGQLEKFTKKEASRIKKEMDKLYKNLSGIIQMRRLPAALFVVDPKKEDIAVREAKKLSIPVASLIDTNSDPDMIDFIIPGNDDAIKSIKFVTTLVADAVLEGRRIYAEGRSKEEERRAAEAGQAESAQAGKFEIEEKVIDEVEEVIEKKIKKPDIAEVKMKKKAPRPVRDNRR